MPSPPSRQPIFPLRTVVLGALIPAFVFSAGLGAILPIIAPFAVEQGASLAAAGLIAAMLPVGQILADLPAGALASRLGDRAAMLLAGSLAGLAFLAAALSPSLITLGTAILLVGAANAVFQLARHSYLTVVTPATQRARVLSTLGGVHRIGQFVGPFLGALVTLGGDTRGVFLVAVATSAAATVTVLLARPQQKAQPQQKAEAAAHAELDADAARSPAAKPTLLGILVEHRRMFLTLGTVALLVGIIRGARQQVIPLWGEHIGLDPTTISLIFGLAGGIDMLLFYPAGKVMDRFGRLWLGVPAMVLLGITMALIPVTATVSGLAIVGVLLGFANGLGSGIMMTISSDVSPEIGRPQFLGIWRLLTDIGMGAGPLILSGGAALGSLAVGVWVAAAMGPLSSAGMQRWLSRYSDHANRTTRRRAGLL
ncbi:MFS transporter [Nesterenkonia cremea]|uniref:MFS transporter n=1 Tax=Nesterenkonia cremea TaxID=1882340 RepID=A0A917AUV4_9MICC|nr:MFS transporter [Nesterenkonia cremea]GGE72371.1 MFS transporter [Nesterenkonia cremea]